MTGAWFNFGMLIVAQLLIFFVCAFSVKRVQSTVRILALGVITGLVFGLAFDLVGGMLIGLHSYELGFSPFFLVINAALSYGVFAATVLLLQRVSTVPLFAWILLIVTGYEGVNMFFPVWSWVFASPTIQFVIILLVGYSAGTFFIASIWHFLLGYKFTSITALFGGPGGNRTRA